MNDDEDREISRALEESPWECMQRGHSCVPEALDREISQVFHWLVTCAPVGDMGDVDTVRRVRVTTDLSWVLEEIDAP